MSEYHVGCGNFGIYAGVLRKTKKIGDNAEAQWLHKDNVTDEAISAVAQYFLQEEQMGKGFVYRFTYTPTGKKYELSLSEVQE